MIDFRYHVVSIIAVFLALSVGLVLGSSFLSELAKEDLDNKIQDLNRSREALRNEGVTKQATIDQLNGFITAAKPDLVDGKLTGKSVVLITLPGADSDITDATAKTMQESGATVTGTIAIKSGWVDPAKETALAAAAGEQAGQSAYDKAATALASAIVHKSAGGSNGSGSTGTPTPGATPTNNAPTTAPTSGPTPNPGPTSTPTPGATGTAPGGSSGDHASTAEALTALNRFKNAGFVDVKGNPETGATLAVIVAPAGAVTGDDPGRVNSIYLGLSRTVDGADDGTVMAGDAASVQSNGTVAALRNDDRTSKVVSSVEAADTDPGQVSVDWALVVESGQGNKSGQYGPTTEDGWLPHLPADSTQKSEKTS
ncbi:MAG: copper transporter [Streptomycetaceae bacterium]|nr:copper transporter [Streptomycetaceae bacterium]